MISHSQLTSILNYDPETGVFTWAVGRRGCKAGSIAGTKLGPHYRQIMIDRIKYSAHRLAWFYVNGSWPVGPIDHERHSEGDKISNLREATATQNRHNTAPKNGTSKWKGVCYDKGRLKCWKMSFKYPDGSVKGKRFYDEREAAEEYMFLALQHHGEFLNLG